MGSVYLSGSSGFLGQRLTSALQKKGFSVFPLIRKGHTFLNSSDLEGSDILIHLAGENVGKKRWSAKQKKELQESRILTTRSLVKTLLTLKKPPRFISASAVGFYGDRKRKVLTEEDSAGKGFLASLCKKWEEEALKAKEKDIPVTILRTGTVLGEGGMLPKILPLFKNHLGAILGSGKEWMSWIHEEDWVNALLFILEEKMEGAINITSPYPVQSSDFAHTLGRVLNKKVLFKMPPALVKLLMGERSDLLLFSTKAIPHRLMEKGFFFSYPSLDLALKNLLAN